MAETTNSPKKLIEVAPPLEAINAANEREKSIRHGHPSTLHLWWARRPIAGAAAITIAKHEILYFLYKLKDFIPRIVELLYNTKPWVHHVGQSFQRAPGFMVTSYNYDFAGLIARAAKPR